MPEDPAGRADAERTTANSSADLEARRPELQVMKRLDIDAMLALRDSARVTVQQSIETVSEAVTGETFAVSSLLVARFREALRLLLQVRDALDR